MILSLNGKTNFNGVRHSIYWVGQSAEHVAGQHTEDPVRRPGIQKTQTTLQRSANHRLPNGRIAAVYIVSKTVEYQKTILTIWEKKSNFAVIRTSQIFNSTPKKLLKGKGIGKTDKPKKKLSVDDLTDDYVLFAQENDIPLDFLVKILNKHLTGKKK